MGDDDSWEECYGFTTCLKPEESKEIEARNDQM